MNFIALISRLNEKEKFCSAYPNHQFVFASLSAKTEGVINLNDAHINDGFAALKKIHSQTPFSGVLNAKEKFVRLRHQIETHLHLPPSVSDPDLFRDKWRQKRLLTQEENTPSTYLIRNTEDLHKIPKNFFPSVLKPRFGFNSRSVVVVHNLSTLTKAFTQTRKQFALMKNEDTDCLDFVLEKYCGGAEHTVECFVQKGRLAWAAISDKDAMFPPFFVETGDLMPTRLSAQRQQLIQTAAQKAIQRLQIHYGWAHIEIKLDGQQTTVIEAAARMGGGYFNDMFQKAYGVDRMEKLIEGHSKQPVSFPREALTTVKGQRIVAWGLTLLHPFRKPCHKVLFNPHFQLIWPSHLDDTHALIIGPPYGYKNTILEYFVSHEDPDIACQLSKQFYEELRIPQYRLPRMISNVIWNALSFATRQGKKRKLDV